MKKINAPESPRMDELRTDGSKLSTPDSPTPDNSGQATGTLKGITHKSRTVTPEGIASQVPTNYGQPDCACVHCRQSKGRRPINHGTYKPAAELGTNEVNRVSLPGDVDYEGAATVLMEVV